MDSLNVECGHCRSSSFDSAKVLASKRTNQSKIVKETNSKPCGAIIIAEQMPNLNDSVESVASGVTISII